MKYGMSTYLFIETEMDLKFYFYVKTELLVKVGNSFIGE